MEKQILSIVLLILVVTVPLQGLLESSIIFEKLAIKRQLELLNKPSIKSFTTKYGEILDCIDPLKQLAFDHPRLKNHSIQMRYNRLVTSKRTKTRDDNSSIRSKLSQFLPKDQICPRGTVMVKRLQEEDIAFNKLYSSTHRIKLSNSSEFRLDNDQPSPMRLMDALMVTLFENTGVGGMINIWSPEVGVDQYSSAFISVGTHDGPNTIINFREFIKAGWAVIPSLYPNNATRLFAYWTRDGGATTGCFNVVCEGFVQVSRMTTLGLMLDKISTYEGQQYTLDLKIMQNNGTNDWDLFLEDELIGYWPKDLFDTLADGAEMVAVGGEILYRESEPSPAMGSGHFPNEGFGKASFIKNIELSGAEEFPKLKDLKASLTNSSCHRMVYMGNLKGMGHTLLFGGPPNC